MKNDWIDFEDSCSLRIGYKYNGQIEINISIPIPYIGLPMKSDKVGYKPHSIKLRNPIIRPFRKLDDESFEFGIHDKNDDEIKTVVPYFRFSQDDLDKNSKFKKVKISKLQKHEYVLMQAKEKALNGTMENFITMFQEVKIK